MCSGRLAGSLLALAPPPVGAAVAAPVLTRASLPAQPTACLRCSLCHPLCCVAFYGSSSLPASLLHGCAACWVYLWTHTPCSISFVCLLACAFPFCCTVLRSPCTPVRSVAASGPKAAAATALAHILPCNAQHTSMMRVSLADVYRAPPCHPAGSWGGWYPATPASMRPPQASSSLSALEACSHRASCISACAPTTCLVGWPAPVPSLPLHAPPLSHEQALLLTCQVKQGEETSRQLRAARAEQHRRHLNVRPPEMSTPDPTLRICCCCTQLRWQKGSEPRCLLLWPLPLQCRAACSCPQVGYRAPPQACIDRKAPESFLYEPQRQQQQ